jgi:hypothetical protein
VYLAVLAVLVGVIIYAFMNPRRAGSPSGIISATTSAPTEERA